MASEEATIEICENQRAWIGGGFSSTGLLPNDRKQYSTVDGSLSFQSTDESSDVLLTRGWAVVPNSTFEVSSEWQYARDFSKSAVAHCQTVRNRAFHWVRFRRLSRPIQLDPKAFLAEAAVVDECDHVDSLAVHKLSSRLVDVMTYMSLLMQPNGNSVVEDGVALPIKKRVLALIDIQDELSRFSSASIRLTHILKQLTDMAVEERRMAKHLLSNIGSYDKRTQEPLWPARRATINNRYWSEGNTLAGWIIRMIDPDYEFHCGVARCGASCEFVWEVCPNPGCSVVISQKHMSTHNDSCQYKIIECDCGASVPKHQMQAHLSDACALRDTNCPFEPIGCTKLLQARHVPQHIEEATDAHLILAMNRIVEIQNVVRQLSSNLRTLQEENAQLKSSLEVVEKRAATDYKGLDKSLNNTMKRVSGLENKTQKEFRDIKHREKRANEKG